MPYPSAVEPQIIETDILNWIRNGMAYNYTTGQQATAGAANSTEVSVFNPANSGKSILIYSIRVLTTVAANGQLRLITTDPALTAGTIQNKRIGGPATVATCTWSMAAQTVTGTALEAFNTNGTPQLELLSNGACFLLPNGVANGLAIFVNATGVLTETVTMRGIEF